MTRLLFSLLILAATAAPAPAPAQDAAPVAVDASGALRVTTGVTRTPTMPPPEPRPTRDVAECRQALYEALRGAHALLVSRDMYASSTQTLEVCWEECQIRRQLRALNEQREAMKKRSAAIAQMQSAMEECAP